MLLASVFGALGAPAVAQPARKPNLIVIMADDLGYGDVSSYNPDHSVKRKDGRPLTPAVDALGENGMRFTNAHAPSAQCTPTRYSLLTGNHVVRTHRTEFVQIDYNDVWLPKEHLTLAQLLRAHGYRTHFSGKWHLGYNVRDRSGELVMGAASDRRNEPDWFRNIEDGPTERGFETSFGHLDALNNPPWKMFRNDRWTHPQSAWVETAHYFKGVDVINAGGGYADANAAGEPVFRLETVVRQIQEDAVSKIGELGRTQQPYFLFVCLSSPHVPTTPNPDVVGSTPHLYTDFVAETDDVVAAIVRQLGDTGQLENTIIAFTSDNGARVDIAVRPDHFGIGIVDGVRLRGGKCSIYEGGTRVPLVIQWGDPAHQKFNIRAGQVSPKLVDLSDLMATMASLVGASLPANQAVDSFNLLPTLLGTAIGVSERRVLITNSQEGHMAITRVDDDGTEWKLLFSSGAGSSFGGVGPVGVKARAMFDLDGRKAWHTAQLYNLTADVGEQNNLLAPEVIDDVIRKKAASIQRTYWSSIRSGRTAPMPAQQ